MRCRELIRSVDFDPYISGTSFKLQLYGTNIPDSRRNGRTMIGYRLWQIDRDRATLVFDGDDFGPSPSHSDDADESVASLMSFLTLRPGDTDADYFDDYTSEQLDFAASHGEALSICATDLFGEP